DIAAPPLGAPRGDPRLANSPLLLVRLRLQGAARGRRVFERASRTIHVQPTLSGRRGARSAAATAHAWRPRRPTFSGRSGGRAAAAAGHAPRAPGCPPPA